MKYGLILYDCNFVELQWETGNEMLSGGNPQTKLLSTMLFNLDFS